MWVPWVAVWRDRELEHTGVLSTVPSWQSFFLRVMPMPHTQLAQSTPGQSSTRPFDGYCEPNDRACSGASAIAFETHRLFRQSD